MKLDPLPVLSRSAMAALALFCALPAQARLGPGTFIVYDVTRVCLEADGTWYSGDFPGLGGRWQESGTRLTMYGNYDGGAGNDSMVFSNRYPMDAMHNPGIWTEWRDDMSWHTVAPNAYIYKLADVCDVQAATPSPGRADPLRR